MLLLQQKPMKKIITTNNPMILISSDDTVVCSLHVTFVQLNMWYIMYCLYCVGVHEPESVVLHIIPWNLTGGSLQNVDMLLIHVHNGSVVGK